MKTLALTKAEYEQIMEQREDNNFEVEIEKLKELEKKEFEFKAELTKEKNNLLMIKELEKKDFIPVIHTNHVTLLKYKIEKKDDEYYGIEYKNGNFKKSRDDVTDEDLELVKKIIKG